MFARISRQLGVLRPELAQVAGLAEVPSAVTSSPGVSDEPQRPRPSVQKPADRARTEPAPRGAEKQQVAVSLVIPAHNEEKRLSATLRRYSAALAERYGTTTEILVVANGCTDRTAEVAIELSRELPSVKVVDIPEPIGKGGAVLEGFRRSTGRAVLFADADGATEPASLLALTDQLERYHVVIGSRRFPGARVPRPQPLRRRMLSRLFNFTVRGVFGLPFSDTQCGAKALRGDAARRLAEAVHERRWLFDLDLLLAARRLGFSIAERPVVWSDVDGSHLKVAQTAREVVASLARLALTDAGPRAILRSGALPPAPSPDARRILALNWRCIRHPEAGGAELNLFEQARHWRNSGHSVTIVTAAKARGAYLPPVEILDGIVIRRMGGRFTVYPWVAWFLTWNAFRYHHILDVANGIPFFTPLFTPRPSALLVHHVCGKQWYEEFSRPLALVGSAIESSLLAVIYRDRPVIAVSPTTRDELVATGFRPDQITVVYNGVTAPAAAEIAAEPGNAEGAATVVYVGRLMRYKRLDLLVSAFAAIRSHVPAARLHIVGDGEMRTALEATIEELGMRGSVTLHGFVDEATKARILHEATVFATPSMQEGWGLSVIEANSHGCPAVAFDVPGLRHSVVDGETGFLVDDEEGFAAALHRLLTDGQLRERMSSAARTWAARFSWEAAAESTFAVLDSPRVRGTEGGVADAA